MSVLAVFQWEGDPDALPAAYDRELQHSAPRNQPRRVTHICPRGDNEVVIVDLWETEQDLQTRMQNPESLRNLDAAGWPSEPIEQTYQVHATIPRSADRGTPLRPSAAVSRVSSGWISA